MYQRGFPLPNRFIYFMRAAQYERQGGQLWEEAQSINQSCKLLQAILPRVGVVMIVCLLHLLSE